MDSILCHCNLHNRLYLNPKYYNLAPTLKAIYRTNLRFKAISTMAIGVCNLATGSAFRSNVRSMLRVVAQARRGNPAFTVQQIELNGFNISNRCRWFTTDADDRKSFLTQNQSQQRDLIKGVIKERKDRFQATKTQLKESSQTLLQDIKKTKDEMKERMEEVIEKENIYTIPNFLTVSRIVMSPYLGYLVVQTDYKMALGLFAYAAITDAMDGMIARRYPSQQSKIGSFLDPMADKVLIATLFLSLTYVDLIPVALTGMIITRDLLLVGAGFVIRYQSLPAPKTFSRYFDATHATAQLQPTFISKMNTLVQLGLVASTLAAPVFNYVDHPALHAMWYFTAFSTAVSALSYVLTKNTYRINRKDR